MSQKEDKSSRNEIRINARVPRSLKDLMKKFVALDTHLNESDLIRDSIREKIQRDAPQLYSQLFEEALKMDQSDKRAQGVQ